MDVMLSLSKKSKKVISANYVKEYESIFKCPICHSAMCVSKLTSLVCVDNHTFDFAKQGYLNLLTRPVKAKYSKELFEARRKLLVEDRFFDPLLQAIAKVIKKQSKRKSAPLFILDTGCGEGSPLSELCQMVSSELNTTVVGVGIDLSKEGILTASKNYAKKIWCVADLAHTPFKDKHFDVILNILSPSNYAEFNRLLKDDGFVIKVVPGGSYLKELREAIYEEPERRSYSNQETVKLFKENFHHVGSSNIHYTMNLDHPSMQSLVRMTPLTWVAAEERINLFLEQDSTQMTVDLDVLMGRAYHHRR